MYSIKMRASKKVEEKEIHISGAERIVSKDRLLEVLELLERRAFSHEKGEPDCVHLTIEKICEEILYLPQLKVQEKNFVNHQESTAFLVDFLRGKKIKEAEKIVELLKNTRNMRGAILLDVHTLKRLEPDQKRGIRATYMDYEKTSYGDLERKNHFLEALVLATKVAHAPGIIAELCISDDPNYLIGYVATKQEGYIRLMPLKEKGSQEGARIFLMDSKKTNPKQTMEYLENKKVLVYEKSF